MAEPDWADLGGGTAAESESEISRSRPGRHDAPTSATLAGFPSETGPGWVGIAANAASGRGGGRVAVARLARELDRLGLEPRVAWTLDERRAMVDAASNANRRSGRCRCLVAAGGDGTVAALINERPDVPIAVMPAGTENLFARHFGFGRHPARAASRIAQGRAEPLDLGLIDGRRFALMAGFGFDADVVSRHHAARVGRTGQLRPTHRAAYVEPVLRSTFGYRFPALTVTAEGADGRRRDPDRDDRVRLQPAPLRARPAVRPFGRGGRRLARPGRLPRPRRLPGPPLSLAGRPGPAPRPSRDRPSEGPPGFDRGGGAGARPARWRPRRRDRARRRAPDHRGFARGRRSRRPALAARPEGRGRLTGADRSVPCVGPRGRCMMG